MADLSSLSDDGQRLSDSGSSLGILLITWNFPPNRGGIERLLFHLAKGLQQNHPLFVITAHGARWDGPRRNFFPAPLPGLLFFSFYALYRGLLILLTHSEIKVIYGGSALTTPLVCLLAWFFRGRKVTNVYGSDVVYESFLYQNLCVRWLRYFDRVVAISHYTAELVQSKGVREDRIRVVSPSVECDRFAKPYSQEKMKRQLGLEARRVVLYVGRLTKRKGVREFLDHSFPLIRERVEDAFFLIVGEDPRHSLIHRDRLAQELACEIKRSGNQHHVRLLESLTDEDLIKAYLACDLLVLPLLPITNDVEGFGTVIMEAAAAGRPSVATKVGGVTEAIEDGKSGLLVDPLDIKGLAEAVVTLLQDEKKRLAMGEYGKKRARECYDWAVITQRYERILLEL